MRRFDIHLPAAVRIAGIDSADFLTETQNISAKGIFFYMDRALLEGTRVVITMTLPPHITLTQSMHVRFTARIVRVESSLPSARVGVAASIEDYEFLRSDL